MQLLQNKMASMLAVVVLLVAVHAMEEDLEQLNTFRVPTGGGLENEVLLDAGASCSATNFTFSIGCGITPRLNTRNVPSDVAAFGEFPWQVAVLDSYEQRFLCSGVLVSARSVLTAARCVLDVPATDLRVRVGEWDILQSGADPRETYRSLEMSVSKKYVSPDVLSPREAALRSVTLLKLRQPVPWGEVPHAAPACLPPTLHERDLAQLQRCWVAGWAESPLTPLQVLTSCSTSSPPAPGSEEEAACWASSRPQRHPGAAPRGVLDAEQRQQQSRLLGKASVRVLSREACLAAMPHLLLDSAHFCLLPLDTLSHPCQADMGAPVLCEVAAPSAKRAKYDRPEPAPRVAVVGVVTQGLSCRGHHPASPSGSPTGAPTGTSTGPEQQRQTNEERVVLATSVLGVLDTVCRLAGATKH